MTFTTLRPAHQPGSPARPPLGPRAVIEALSACLLLLCLLLGVPYVLVELGAPLLSAVPTSATGWHDAAVLFVTTPDDGTLLFAVVTLLGWVGWLTFTTAVVLESAALARGRLPRRLPLMGVQQRAAAGLVASVAVLVTAPLAVAASPAAPQATPPAPAPVTTTTGASVDQSSGAAAPLDVVVRPGDTLWGIAERHLGEGDVFPAIVEASRDVVQPGGQRLADPDRIFPGWHVIVPADAAPAPAPAPSPHRSSGTSSSPPSPAPTVGGDEQRSSMGPSPVPTLTASSPAASATPRGGPGDQAPEEPEEPVSSTAEIVVITTGLSALTAVGLITLLRSRRARQRRTRRPGDRIPAPPVGARQTQARLVSEQTPLTVSQLDTALRSMAARCVQDDSPLPQLTLVRLLPERLELHLATPSRPVAPFTAAGPDDTVWTTTAESVGSVEAEGTTSTAPYPSLVAVGHDLDGAQILIDLKTTGGLLLRDRGADAPGTGGGVGTSSVLSALVVELATSTWGQSLDVVCIGLERSLVAALDVDGLRSSTDGTQVVTELTAWSREASVGLAAEDPGEHDTRIRGAELDDLLRPRIVVVGPQSADPAPLLSALHGLRTASPDLPLAVISAVQTDSSGAGQAGSGWTMDIDPATSLGRLSPSGLTLRPHHLAPNLQEHVIQSLAAAGAPLIRSDEGDARTPIPAQRDDVLEHPATDTSKSDDESRRVEPSHDVPQPADADSDATAARAQVPPPAEAAHATGLVTQHPTLNLLGHVGLVGARGHMTGDGHESRMLEVLAFLALHPSRERFLLEEAMWPGQRVPDARRQQLISRARRWLGTTPDGEPYLPNVYPHGYALHPAVQTDWRQFQTLVGGPADRASTESLRAALQLVHGQPFAGTDPRRYGWADTDRQEMICAIVDVAHELTIRFLGSGDALTARWAVTVGLRVEPGSELLWRDALRAERLAGNREGLLALAERFELLSEELGGDMEPETEVLLAELLPATPRTGAAMTGDE